MTFGAECFAAVTREHHAILNLILVALEHLEKTVDAGESAHSMPQLILLFLRQFAVGLVYRKTERRDSVDEVALPRAHHLPFPTLHGPFVDRQGRIRNHQPLVDTETTAEPLTARARTIGIVEVEQQIRRLDKLQAVSLEAFREFMAVRLALIVPDNKGERVAPLEKRRLGRVGQTRKFVGVVRDTHAVDQQFIAVGLFRFLFRGEKFVEREKFPIPVETRVAPLAEHLEMLRQRALPGYAQRRHHRQSCAGRICRGGIDHIRDAVAAHLHPRNRRESVPHAAEKQTQVIVDFRGSAHGASRIAGVDLLFDGHRRREPAYEIHLRFGHLAQKLACVGRQTLHIAALTLGIKRVERQRRLARTAQAGDHHQPSARHRDINILKIVDAGALHLNVALGGYNIIRGCRVRIFRFYIIICVLLFQSHIFY